MSTVLDGAWNSLPFGTTMEDLTLLARVALGFVTGLAVFGPVAWYLQKAASGDADGVKKPRRR